MPCSMAKPGLGEEEEIQFMINGAVQQVSCSFILERLSIVPPPA